MSASIHLMSSLDVFDDEFACDDDVDGDEFVNACECDGKFEFNCATVLRSPSIVSNVASAIDANSESEVFFAAAAEITARIDMGNRRIQHTRNTFSSLVAPVRRISASK